MSSLDGLALPSEDLGANSLRRRRGASANSRPSSPGS